MFQTHVIQLIDVIEYKQDHYIFLEYMEGNDLSERLKEKQVLTENIAKLYFYQICKGVQYLHSLGIIHRDIKVHEVIGMGEEGQWGNTSLKLFLLHISLLITAFSLASKCTPCNIQHGHHYQID